MTLTSEINVGCRFRRLPFGPRGFAIVDAPEAIAEKHGVKSADIALAWIVARASAVAS